MLHILFHEMEEVYDGECVKSFSPQAEWLRGVMGGILPSRVNLGPPLPYR